MATLKKIHHKLFETKILILYFVLFKCFINIVCDNKLEWTQLFDRQSDVCVWQTVYYQLNKNATYFKRNIWRTLTVLFYYNVDAGDMILLWI